MNEMFYFYSLLLYGYFTLCMNRKLFTKTEEKNKALLKETNTPSNIYRKDIYLRNSHPEVLLRKGVQKICSKCTGEHPCQSVIRHGCSPVNLLHIFRTHFPMNTSWWMLLKLSQYRCKNDAVLMLNVLF